jgi:hypothetical protein
MKMWIAMLVLASGLGALSPSGASAQSQDPNKQAVGKAGKTGNGAVLNTPSSTVVTPQGNLPNLAVPSTRTVLGQQGITPALRPVVTAINQPGFTPALGQGQQAFTPDLGQRGFTPDLGQRGFTPDLGQRGFTPAISQQGSGTAIGQQSHGTAIGRQGGATAIGLQGSGAAANGIIIGQTESFDQGSIIPPPTGLISNQRFGQPTFGSKGTNAPPGTNSISRKAPINRPPAGSR